MLARHNISPVCLYEAASSSATATAAYGYTEGNLCSQWDRHHSIGSRQYLEYPPEDLDHEASMSARLLECSSRWEASAIVLSVNSDAFRIDDLRTISLVRQAWRC